MLPFCAHAVQSLMNSLRREPSEALQTLAADALAELLACCLSRPGPCPNEKLLRNLAAMACGDPAETPNAATAGWVAGGRGKGMVLGWSRVEPVMHAPPAGPELSCSLPKH